MEKLIREGDLYKSLTVFGKTFHLYYGYYDEQDRRSSYREPIPLYPDFTKNPRYTDAGEPFVTQMQDPCPCFEGDASEDGCYACRYYRQGDDLIGACTCDRMKRAPTAPSVSIPQNSDKRLEEDP